MWNKTITITLKCLINAPFDGMMEKRTLVTE
jgi:hypothetical protein